MKWEPRFGGLAGELAGETAADQGADGESVFSVLVGVVTVPASGSGATGRAMEVVCGL